MATTSTYIMLKWTTFSIQLTVGGVLPHQLRSVRRSLPTDMLQAVVHTFITERTDYCNVIIMSSSADTDDDSHCIAADHWCLSLWPYHAGGPRLAPLTASLSAHQVQHSTDGMWLLYCVSIQPTGRTKEKEPLGKIRYLWNCSRYIYQIYRVYRWGFSPHILQILLK